MSRLNQTLSLIVAVALQFAPLLKNLLTAPAANSGLAIVFRWMLVSTAALESVDAVSGTTSKFTTTNVFNGTVGAYFSNNVSVAIGGGNTASRNDYFVLSSASGTSPLLTNGASSSVTLPPGLSFKSSWVNGSSTIGGILYGTPTVAGTNSTTITVVSPGNASLGQAVTFYITGSGSTSPPGITTQPAAVTVVAGQTATFTTVASGSSPLIYAWLKNGITLTNGGNLSGTATATLMVSNVSATDVGNYSVIVSNSAGAITSSNALLTILMPPQITAQPVAQTALSGSNAAFAVTATGSAPLTYLWYKDGAVLANGTKYGGVSTPGLTISNLALTDAGSFSVVVTNLAGSVTSSVVPLTVLAAPGITAGPAKLTIVVGNSATFSVTASGTAPLSYQWLKNGVNLTGATSSAYTISSVTTNDGGSYSVLVTNVAGSLLSAAATLTVLVPPAIVVAPASTAVNGGSNVSFTVAATGTAPLAYQWLKNGVALANGGSVAGANSTALTLTGVTALDAASFSVTVSNVAGSVTSAAATLTVLGPPAITTQPLSVTVIQGSNATFTATVSGTAPLTYQWLKNGAVINGANANALTLNAVTTNDAGNYSLLVTNVAGSLLSSTATLTVLVPPAIAVPPSSVAVNAGSNVSFSVTATGTAPLAYQWLKNGVAVANGGNVSGAATSTLVLSAVAAADAASYSVTVSNVAGSVTSAAATLTVLGPPVITTQPVSVTVVQGSNATFTASVTGTAPLVYQWLKNGVVINGANSNALTLNAVTTNDTGNYSLLVTNLAGSLLSSTATLTVLVPPTIAVPPSSVAANAGSNVSFAVSASGTAPLAYQWLKNGVALTNGGNVSGATTSTLLLSAISPADAASYSVTVTNAVGGVTSAGASLVVQSAPTITMQLVGTTVILGNPASLIVTASGSGVLAYQWLKNNLPIAGANSNVLYFAVTTTNDAATYTVLVTNSFGSVTSAGATLNVLIPPAIVSQPVGGSVVTGTNITLSVTVSGTAPLSYQWLLNRVSLSGATSPTLNLTGVTSNNAGTYTVVVTNVAGSVTSAAAVLTVLSAPLIITQPASQLAVPGGSVVLSVVASGSNPLTYQWYKGGLAITGGTNLAGFRSDTLTINPLGSADAGTYYVVVSNSLGSAISSSAMLSVASGQGGFIGTTGNYFSNNVTIVLPPGNSSSESDYFLINAGAVNSGLLANGFTDTTTMPPGLTFQANWTDGISTLSGMVYGTPTAAGVYSLSFYAVLPGQVPVLTNLTFTIINGSTPALPSFLKTIPPLSVTAGTTTNITVQVSGSSPMTYQWYYQNNVAVASATQNTLQFSNIRASQAGNYTLVVANASGSVTSSPVAITVTLPAGPMIQPPVVANHLFQFIFNPVVGLTNTVLASDVSSGGIWTVVTNVPPPLTASPVTVIDPMGGANRFYRVMVVP